MTSELWTQRLERTSVVLSAVLLALGIIVQAGWALDVPLLQSAVTGFVTMKPNAAACFILVGAGMLALRSTAPEWLAKVLGSALMVIAGLTLSQDVFGWSLGIDESFYSDASGAAMTGAPGRMAPFSAIAFFVTGAAVFSARRATIAAQVMMLITGLIGYFALSCYILERVPATQLESFSAMAVHTAAGFILAVPALWFAQPRAGMAVVFCYVGMAGRVARGIFPTAIAVPLLAAGLTAFGTRMGWFSLSVGNAVVVLLSCILYTLFAWALVGALRAFHVERSGFQSSLGKAGTALESKRRELEQFAFTVSHDLKSPLVSIRGFLGLMRQDLAAGRMDDALDSAQDVDEAAQHMSALIDDLLSYSRIGRSDEKLARVNMRELLEDLVELHRTQSEKAEARVSVARDVPACFGYPASLRRAIENLYINALRYGRKAGKALTIELGGELHGDERRYFVRDHGPGIEPQYHERIFGLFQRLDTTDQRGTGLGLASVAKVAEQHGGRAWVESAPGQGATFWMSTNLEKESKRTP